MSRRTGARRFVRSGAVSDDWLPWRLSGRPLTHLVGRHAHTAGDSRVTAAARRAGTYVEHDRRVGTGERHGQLLRSDPWDVLVVATEQPGRRRLPFLGKRFLVHRPPIGGDQWCRGDAVENDRGDDD